ncbi:MAG TPA: hypothetical protein VGS41_13290, partial [Chthonomonadales bacterium]|nr:hypothetical protein [Chthonomonadales bacterium]
MPVSRVAGLVVLALLTTVACRAQGQTADPGFAYVDVDGDGLYTPSVDIGLDSTPSVDINALIRTGSFNTSVSQGS